VYSTVVKGQIEQVIINMILNARDAVTPPGRIVIGLKKKEKEAVITISDNGKGISPENLTRIFEPFFSSKTVGQGSGLGLYVSHRIIEDSGGHIRVSSVLGEGTTFTVYLPLATIAGDTQ
jgi:two-component system, NtrC family, sensor kinase